MDKAVDQLWDLAPGASLHTALAPDTQSPWRWARGSGAIVRRGAARATTNRDEGLQHECLEKPCRTSCDQQAGPRMG